MPKIKVKESSFLNWYFSDDEDKLIFATNLISELYASGYIEETVQSLLDRCGPIPGFISETPNDHNEYDPENVELITDREPILCWKCNKEQDRSMKNFCQHCLSAQ